MVCFKEIQINEPSYRSSFVIEKNVLLSKEDKCASLDFHWHRKFSWRWYTHLISVEKKILNNFLNFFHLWVHRTKLPTIYHQNFYWLVSHSIMALQHIVCLRFFVPLENISLTQWRFPYRRKDFKFWPMLGIYDHWTRAFFSMPHPLLHRFIMLFILYA